MILDMGVFICCVSCNRRSWFGGWQRLYDFNRRSWFGGWLRLNDFNRRSWFGCWLWLDNFNRRSWFGGWLRLYDFNRWFCLHKSLICLYILFYSIWVYRLRYLKTIICFVVCH